MGVRGLLHSTRSGWFWDARRGSIAAVGDSITRGSSGYGWHSADSWFSHVVRAHRGGRNAGVPDETTVDILRRVGPVARDMRTVVVAGGTNDLIVGMKTSAIVARLDQAVTIVRGAGAEPVLATVPPIWSDVYGDQDELNPAIRELAGARGTSLLDFHSVVSDGEWWLPGYTADDVHPTAIAARVMGEHALTVLAGQVRVP